jgi:two-component system, NtrC family, sensor kinase
MHGPVRLGIRAQLLLSMAALLVLAFAPLFFAVASLARASFEQVWEDNAQALGRAVAGHVAEARQHRDDEALGALLEAQVGRGIAAIGVYDDGGALVASAGEAKSELPPDVAPARAEVRKLGGAASGMVVVVPGSKGPITTLLRADEAILRVAPLVQSVALYIGLLGLALLVVAYFVLTRLVVTPLVGLSRAAQKVADGGRELQVPPRGGRELLALGVSLSAMTATLRAEEEQLRTNVTELEEAAEDLRRAQDTVVRGERLASVGRLAAGLAHEIGNPIAAILSFQELLLDGELEEEQRDFLERMKRETDRVNGILRDLLDFARPGAAPTSEDVLVSASVADVVEHVTALVKPQKSFKGVALDVQVASGLPAVAMRAQRIEQVLLNLLLNAADVVPSGEEGRVALSARAHDGGVRIVVEDNGGGVDPAIRDTLFEPFVTTKDVGEGTGLGLAVCRGLVESVAGTIDAEDGDRGARFVVWLPALVE